MDDVGLERSSLGGLVVLEPETVKIDRRDVNGVSRDPSERRVLRRPMLVVESSNATVIAEGLEEQHDVPALLDPGVRYAHGFLLGRPAPTQES